MDKNKVAVQVPVKCCFDKDFRELKEHGTAETPVVVYETVFHRHGDYGLHWHRELEYVYVNKGSVLFRINQNEFRAAEGDFISVPRGAMHSVRYDSSCPENAKITSLLFDPDILNGPAQEYCQKNLVHPLLCGQLVFPFVIEQNSHNYNAIVETFHELFTCFRSMPPFYQIRIKGLLFELFYNLFQEGSYTYNKQITNKTVNAIINVIDYIQTHFEEGIYIGKLAEIANYNENYFMKVFRDYTGKTIMKFINDFRLEKSKELLKSSELSVDEIAYKTGFSSASYYIRAFKNKYRATPKEFRHHAE